MFLAIGILISLVFISQLIDLITGNRSFSQVSLKEIIYLIGWLFLSIACLVEYSKQQN